MRRSVLIYSRILFLGLNLSFHPAVLFVKISFFRQFGITVAVLYVLTCILLLRVYSGNAVLPMSLI